MIVADTNLLVYLFLPGEHAEAAEEVLQRDYAWAVPVLWRSEFRNVLALYSRKELLIMEAAVDAFRQAEVSVRAESTPSRLPAFWTSCSAPRARLGAVLARTITSRPILPSAPRVVLGR